MHMLDPEYLQDILSSPVCSCGSDCSAFWSRELWINLHEPVLDFAQNHRTFLKFMQTLISATCYNAITKQFAFSISGKRLYKTKINKIRTGCL